MAEAGELAIFRSEPELCDLTPATGALPLVPERFRRLRLRRVLREYEDSFRGGLLSSFDIFWRLPDFIWFRCLLSESILPEYRNFLGGLGEDLDFKADEKFSVLEFRLSFELFSTFVFLFL